jgi:hypothetical protein
MSASLRLVTSATRRRYRRFLDFKVDGTARTAPLTVEVTV